MENHYKDNYWQYPEFAQKMDVFCEMVEQIDSPSFRRELRSFESRSWPAKIRSSCSARFNNELLRCTPATVICSRGTIEDLRREEDSIGYAKRLAHGDIGKGLNDYDAIFSLLREVGFDSRISIEDGIHGMDELRESVRFLKSKIDQHFSAQSCGSST